MLQRIFILFTIFINISNSAFGQEFDVKESSRLTKFEGKPILVSLKVLRAVQKTNEYTTEQAAESLSIFEKISKNKNLSRTDKAVVDNMMAGFNIELGEDAKAITLLEEMLLKPRKPRKMELSGYNALAILYHNQGNFIKSIKNLNRWYIYEPTYFHQLEYMLSDNYLQLGDMENAYKTYLNAKKIYDGYITEGPDLGKDMKIFEYDELVENLNDIFSNGLPVKLLKQLQTILFPIQEMSFG
ncbi:MAG: hypothetical protein HOM01_06275 [Kordiimonadaceae bacterium]|nr:hypothetical protein [Kordiimonadaceae bacterium]